MYQQRLTFECFDNTTISAAQQAIMSVFDALRYNGQILGREFPCSFNDGSFVAHVVTPEEDALHSHFHSPQVRWAMNQLSQANILRPKSKVLGRELFSDYCETGDESRAQILYTSFIHSCSPLRSMERFLPIPLYRIPAVANGDQRQVIKWQEDWSACDQLQMNGSILETQTVEQMGQPATRLFQRGWDLAKRISYVSQKPTYLYCYRVGGTSKEEELRRKCPLCGKDWLLAEPLHDVFDFRCDHCRLVSNLSWDFK